MGKKGKMNESKYELAKNKNCFKGFFSASLVSVYQITREEKFKLDLSIMHQNYSLLKYLFNRIYFPSCIKRTERKLINQFHFKIILTLKILGLL